MARYMVLLSTLEFAHLEDDIVHPDDEISGLKGPVLPGDDIGAHTLCNSRESGSRHVISLHFSHVFLDVTVGHDLGINGYNHVLDAIDHVAAFLDDHWRKGGLLVPWHLNFRFAMASSNCLLSTAVA